MLEMVAHLVGGPPIAILADAVGRAHAIAVSVGLLVAARCIFAISVALVHTGGHAEMSVPPALLAVCSILAGLSSVNVPANAMIGDASPAGGAGAVFSRVAIGQAVGGGLGTVVQLLLLRLYLTDYKLVRACSLVGLSCSLVSLSS